MAFEPEHGHGHGHKTGLPWLDVIVAVSVVFISVMSLIVSINHGRTMEKLVQENERMVAADTLPYLTLDSSNLDPTGKPRVSLEVTNGGVGPALVDWLELRWKGRAYASPTEFVQACCGSGGEDQRIPDGVFFGNLSGTILPAREKRELLVATSNAGPKVLAAANAMRSDLSARACYCSVLEECWITDFGPGRPQKVKDCRVPPGVKRW